MNFDSWVFPGQHDKPTYTASSFPQELIFVPRTGADAPAAFPEEEGERDSGRAGQTLPPIPCLFI